MKILIGLPVYKREWILPYWFKAIEKQTVPLSDLGFIFELGPYDDETHKILWDWHANHPEVAVFDGVVREKTVHKTHPPDMRGWESHEYHRMVEFRNNLLERAVGYDPDRYFSLDSDILLTNKSTLEALYQLTADPVSAAPLCYMKAGTIAFPNMMSWRNVVGGSATRLLNRYEIGTVFEVEVSMAAVMMSKPVYQNVRYRWHKQGEDLGWSAEMTRHGYKMLSASNIYAPHIMHRSMLEPFLENGDDRSTDLMHYVP